MMGSFMLLNCRIKLRVVVEDMHGTSDLELWYGYAVLVLSSSSVLILRMTNICDLFCALACDVQFYSSSRKVRFRYTA